MGRTQRVLGRYGILFKEVIVVNVKTKQTFISPNLMGFFFAHVLASSLTCSNIRGIFYIMEANTSVQP